MSYQKQKESKHFSMDLSDLESMDLEISRNDKKKRIKKGTKNISEDDEGLCIKFNNKKKQIAKQIKRVREQNRRAEHKQYVTNLQQQIKNKELKIQKLELKILQLQEKLRAKNCHKCGNQLTDVTNSPPFVIEKEPCPCPVSSQEMQFQLDQSYRRITDESSLKLCFGNKSFLFFLVTMCCLTIGSIADNPQIFLQPIYPFMHKSQMCFLYENQKLSRFQKYGPLMIQRKNQISLKFYREDTKPPTIDNKIKRVSDLLDFKISHLKIPSFMQLIPSIKDSTQLFFSFGTNRIFRRLLQGRNYYV